MMKLEEGWRKNVDFKLSDVGLTCDIRQSLLVKQILIEREGSRNPD